ncbi:gp53-like domain-containing protein [Salmonella enterica]|uniref:gp53-like domain-containing protein n=1 Tax=Salmonella enterica TaxID=28901 RepID=UPI0039B3C398
MIIQWGTTTYTSTLFPIAFPSVCVSVVASNGDYYRDDNNSIRAVSRAGFTPYNAHDTGGNMFWIAIGY